MQTHNLGYPRIGSQRALKKAIEAYWAQQSSAQQLLETARQLRLQHWQLQKDAGIDWIPCNDFSLYDQVLDHSLLVGAIPARYHDLVIDGNGRTIDLLFAMARGCQQNGHDITAMEMTKWFDTNYHYIVPEFTADQHFFLFQNKVLREFLEAKAAGFQAKPVLLGPVSYLLLGKEKESGFDRLDLLDKLLPVYLEVLKQLDKHGAHYIQFDEPCLTLNLSDKARKAVTKAYNSIHKAFPQLHLLLAGYFECYGDNLPTVLNLPVQTIHLDLVRCSSQLDDVLSTSFVNSSTKLSLGLVDGRNIWINDFATSRQLIDKAIQALGKERLWIAPSCSLLHVPMDLNSETGLDTEIRSWLAFARQKLDEVAILKKWTSGEDVQDAVDANRIALRKRQQSPRIHRPNVKARVAAILDSDARRPLPFAQRQPLQEALLQLPLYPTTTIGSFPQTKEVRQQRAAFTKGNLSAADYNRFLEKETTDAIRWQEETGLDVLVHGEFERNDMVEYFGEKLDGFVFTQQGWVQSYGTRCVKPPIIYGDVQRPAPMTVRWTSFAQSLTEKWVKGMLTGPVTILQWSFVRNDQPRSTTASQIALAIRDEVSDLEKAGIRIIQIDEPAIREGLPLRKENQADYLRWAVSAFRLSSSGVQNDTQIHTHMCYSEFNDIIDAIADMDADVITIECSRSQMELLDAFSTFRYPNEIGPGVYDIHSPRVPSVAEICKLMEKARLAIPEKQLWVNPDCGLKTRDWPETRAALEVMVQAAQRLRCQVTVS